jgi:hypothetical protein
MKESKRIMTKGIIAVATFVFLSFIVNAAMETPLDSNGSPPLDKETKSFGEVSDFFIRRFGGKNGTDWVGIHSDSEGYKAALLFEQASLYVIFILNEEREWEWYSIAPYRKPIDLNKTIQEVIDILTEIERKEQFEKLDKELGIDSS